MFRRNGAKGAAGKRNLDGYEAIWQHVTGKTLEFPPPRYTDPVIMKPAHFAWRDSGVAGVRQKDLGRFSDRGTEVTVFRAEPGRRRVLPAADHLRVVFVMKGRGKCGRKDYKRHSALEFGAGEALAITPDTATELLVMTIPSVAALGLKAA